MEGVCPWGNLGTQPDAWRGSSEGHCGIITDTSIRPLYYFLENEMIKIGDIVELLPTNQRNRQLRSQEKKYDWRVIEIGTPQCYFGKLAYLIEFDINHSRWVLPEDVKIKYYRESIDY